MWIALFLGFLDGSFFLYCLLLVPRSSSPSCFSPSSISLFFFPLDPTHPLGHLYGSWFILIPRFPTQDTIARLFPIEITVHTSSIKGINPLHPCHQQSLSKVIETSVASSTRPSIFSSRLSRPLNIKSSWPTSGLSPSPLLPPPLSPLQGAPAPVAGCLRDLLTISHS